MAEKYIKVKDIGTEIYLTGIIRSASFVNSYDKDSLGNIKHRNEVVYAIDIPIRKGLENALEDTITVYLAANDVATLAEMKEMINQRDWNMAINGH